MEEIIIEKEEESDNGWIFSVKIGDKNYKVTVEEDYWKKITEENITPEKLVESSFKFLLEREPKESILLEFNLKQIEDYFPEYESNMGSICKRKSQ